MKKIYLLALLGMALTAQAQERVLTVTPQTLDEWHLTGAGIEAFNYRGNLAVPAQAQLSRKFGESAVIVHANTQPVWWADSREWPIAELGSVALAMVQKDTINQLVVVIDERKVLTLPWTFEQGAALEFSFGYDPISGIGMVGSGGEFEYFEASQPGKMAGLSLTSGATNRWEFSLLEVALLVQPDDVKSEATGSSGKASDRERVQAMLKSSAEKLSAQERVEGSGSMTASQEDTARNVDQTDRYLVVFTPETIRINRADVIRNRIAAQQK